MRRCPADRGKVRIMAKKGDGEVRLTLSIDLDSVRKSVEDAANCITQKLTSSYEKCSKKADQIANGAGKSVQKTIKESEKLTEESSIKIQKILADTEKSMKSKAASIAAVYKKEGMTSSEAMKAAWTQIERGGSDTAEKIKKNALSVGNSVKAAGEQSKKASDSTVSALNKGLGGMAKKAAGMIAAALSVKAIGNFGAKCLELGSDLAEVQNVVDVTFPTMSSQIDKFAQNAAFSFGLSETMAKKFTGTFGSMAEAFGFSEKEAASMATTLTGLAGDVASFYNISQDEAYTKLKSVFSGETETLKDLGIVMTQTALDSYALANGYGKVTSKMSEAEKVSLRFAFVQDQLKNATGDFARTSDSWANQTRILALQFDSLRASLGQGLINIFTPVIKQVNNLMAALVKLASHFKAFTELITGNKSKDGGGVGETAMAAADAASSLDSATDSANNLSDATTSAGKAAKKAAKQMLGLASFDELNNFTSNKESGDSSPSGTGGGGGGVDYGSLADGDNVLDKTGDSLDKLLGKFQPIVDKFKELEKAFRDGFHMGLGNTDEVFASIKNELASIGKSFQDILSNKGLQEAAAKWGTTIATALGQVTGSIASIGLTIADNLLGGISLYLEQHKQDIIDDLTSLFDITGEQAAILGQFSTVVADIATVFRSDEAKQITADIINIFADSVVNIGLLFAKLGRDLCNLITKPIIDNKSKIEDALMNTIRPLSTIINSISDTVSDTWDEIQKLYDEHIKPLIDSLADGISEWMGILLDGYNKYIAPVLDKLSKKFKEVMEDKVKPAVHAIVEAVGGLIDVIRTLWNKWIKPLVSWILEEIVNGIVPHIAKAFEAMADSVMGIIGGILDTIKGIGKVISGVCQTITAIAEGDWKKAWQGVQKAFSGVWDIIVGLFETAFNAIKLTFSPAITFFQGIWNGIQSIFKDVVSWFGTKFTNAYNKATGAFNQIRSFFEKKFSDVKSVLTSVPNWFGTKFSNAYDKVTKAFSNVKKHFKNVLEDVKSPFKDIAKWFEEKFSNAWTKVKNVFSTGGKIFTGIKDGIANTFKTVVNGLIEGINKIIKVPFNAINGMLNKIRGVGIGKVKPFNSLWENNPIKAPQIPKLANGGYVKKNTPQLAMIGDNRHQGEVVAPEDKLQALLDSALKKSGEITAAALVPVIERLCNAIIELEQSGRNYPVLEPVTSTGLYRIVKEEQKKEDNRRGKR